MDYPSAAQVERRPNFSTFNQAMKQGGHRLVLLTSRGGVRLPDAVFPANDVLLLGAAGAGVPAEAHDRGAHRISFPMKEGFDRRSVVWGKGGSVRVDSGG